MNGTIRHRIAFVVPTKDRPDDLRKMLASLGTQTRRPDQVIVVDGSEPPVRNVVEDASGLAVEYVDVIDPDTMSPVGEAASGRALAAAVRVGKTRLIDNVPLP